MMLKDNGKSQIKVFVSYCEKVKRHADRVTELAECLKNKGFLVKFDKWEDPGEGWIAWMQKEIPRADFVICVFERHYRKRFLGDEKGKGASYEGGIISAVLYANYPANDKVIPLLMKTSDSEFVPEALQSYSQFVYPSEFDGLCSAMTKRFERRISGTTLGTKTGMGGDELCKKNGTIQAIAEGIVPVEAIHKIKSRLPGEVFAVELLERPIEIQRCRNDRFLVKIDRRGVKRAVITNSGKDWLCERYAEPKRKTLEAQDKATQDFLLGKSNKDRFLIDLPNLEIPLRWASGGVMSVVTRRVQGREDKWTPFFFRDRKPWGWNIALGSCERWFDREWRQRRTVEKELNDPEEFLLREFREETLILDKPPMLGVPLQFKRFFFDNKWADRQCRESQEFAAKHVEHRRRDDGLDIKINVGRRITQRANCVEAHENRRAMTDIEITDRKGGVHKHFDVLVSFNLMELGIEIVKVFEYAIDEQDYFLDGELRILPDGVSELLRLPVALISHQALERTFGPDVYVPHYTDDRPPSFLGKPLTRNDIKVFDWDIEQRFSRMRNPATPRQERDRYGEWWKEYGKGTKALLTTKGKFNYRNIPRAYVPGTAKTLCQYFARMR